LNGTTINKKKHTNTMKGKMERMERNYKNDELNGTTIITKTPTNTKAKKEGKERNYKKN
jgi:hypothetical protein